MRFSFFFSLLLHLFLFSILFWGERNGVFDVALGEGSDSASLLMIDVKGSSGPSSNVTRAHSPLTRPPDTLSPGERDKGEGSAHSPKKNLENSQGDKSGGDGNSSSSGFQASVSGGGGGNTLLAEIRRKIERALRYPSFARARRMEGVALIRFSIDAQGLIREISLARSSDFPILDEEAMATVRRAAPLPYFPDPVQISLRFSLDGGVD